MTRHPRVPALLLIALIVTACGPSPTSPLPVPVAEVEPTPTPSPRSSPTAAPSPTPSVAPTATPIALPDTADLTGVPIDAAHAHRLPLAVMLDDARAARPQAGFNGASIVYQALADGYESRYLLIFGEGESSKIGPVRSARFYLVQWASEVGAAFAHYGGDARTLKYLRNTPLAATSVDGMTRGNSAFRRTKDRRAPHNAYTSTSKLRSVAHKLGAPTGLDVAYHRRPFIDPSPVEARAKSQSIRVPYKTSVITYAYDRASNSYRRSVNGDAQIDQADGKRVTTTNIVVLFQKFRIDTKIERGHSRPDITTIGKGRALVFREGHVIEGTWSKAGDADPTLILDADGKEIPLVRGRTFIQVVPPKTAIKVGG
jgi:Protein of unknown function (DUF3048) N-terminal domain/Protein of unknown function (DUF3048) C-terminal domain